MRDLAAAGVGGGVSSSACRDGSAPLHVANPSNRKTILAIIIGIYLLNRHSVE
jgi:hypothetical protein